MLKLTRICREDGQPSFRIDILLMTQATQSLTRKGMVFPRYQLVDEITSIPTWKLALRMMRWLEEKGITQTAILAARRALEKVNAH